ncbi:hypothetical protein [Bacillus cereus]|uniref:hypothetical protein n=1 Tax=Bacillus cereus TaxID=1396 RepID=UPI000C03827A|nr:hypothetical protein [Bacillus cereus]PGV89972.1 hypothetical protein COD80_27970 [Bacillus cereus]
MYRGKCTLTKINNTTECKDIATSYDCIKIPVEQPTVYKSATFDAASSCTPPPPFKGYSNQQFYNNPVQQYPYNPQVQSYQPYYHPYSTVYPEGVIIGPSPCQYPYYY